MRNGGNKAVWYSVVIELSILYLRCMHAEEKPEGRRVERCFQFSIWDALILDNSGSMEWWTLSILYLRCIHTPAGDILPNGAVLSILYLRCAGASARERCADSRQQLSILYLRCKKARSRRWARSSTSFNSLFEMLTSNDFRELSEPLMLSILYLRCYRGAGAGAGRAVRVPFNSLFEMPRSRWHLIASSTCLLSILYLRCKEGCTKALC